MKFVGRSKASELNHENVCVSSDVRESNEKERIFEIREGEGGLLYVLLRAVAFIILFGL
jgi:hypothetical protein